MYAKAVLSCKQLPILCDGKNKRRSSLAGCLHLFIALYIPRQ